MAKTNPSRGGLYAIPTVGYFRGRRRLRGWQGGRPGSPRSGPPGGPPRQPRWRTS